MTSKAKVPEEIKEALRDLGREGRLRFHEAVDVLEETEPVIRSHERQRVREALEAEVRRRASEGDWGEHEQGFLAAVRFLDTLEDSHG